MGIKKKAYLSLGSNLGDRFEILQSAVSDIHDRLGEVIKIAPVYETEPVGFTSTSYFLNTCILIETELTPIDLLNGINNIETQFGRVRDSSGEYISRTLDIDILFYENLISNTVELTIPHPRLSERLFVLMPLTDLAPDLIDPSSGIYISTLLQACSDSSQLKRLDLLLNI